MKIGELGRRTDTKVETIRFYEAEGLLSPPDRSSANYRIYTPAHVSRLGFIRRARDLGFTLAQVRVLLELADDPARPCASVDAIARENMAIVDRKLADLARLRGELARLLDACGRGAVGDCLIVEALAGAEERA